MYDIVLFDLDGTLTDSAPGIVAGFQYALEQLGLPQADIDQVRGMIGGPVVENAGRFGVAPDRAEEFVRQFRVYYNETGIFENAPYPGTLEMLGALRASGKRMSIATAKPLPAALRVLERFELAPHFETVVGSEPEGEVMQKALAIGEVLRRIAPPAGAKIAMVGDRSYDMTGASENGIDAIGILHGYGSREELARAGAKHLVEDTGELASLLMNHAGQ